MVYSEVLNEFTDINQRILGGNLVGVYLHGSAAMGCFHPKASDLDLIVVVNESLGEEEKLAIMREVVVLNEKAPAKGIEMSIVRRQFCRPFVYPTPFELHFSVAHLEWFRRAPQDYVEKMKGTDKDLAAHFMILKKYGIPLCGEEIDTVFGDVTPQAYRDSICCDVENAAEEITEAPVYMILNLCRVLAYLREGLILSKKGGGEWGLGALPAEFCGLIARALECYAAGSEMPAEREEEERFAAYMTEQIGAVMMKKTANEIKVSQVKLQDAFWSDIQEKVVDIVIPFQERVLNDQVPGVEKSHAIENFRIAAGLKEGEFYGMVFQDSDLAKWLEGVAYALSVKPDAALEERADEIIAVIEKAQQPDGYLNTYFTIKEPERRWQNLHECHELYCAGHMMEAAVAYAEATGKDRLLHVTERLADHIIGRFGAEEGKEHGVPGHQEVEIGLMKLYHATGKEKYKDMARYFLEERGKNPDYFYQEKIKRGWQHWGQYSMEKLDMTYNQSHQPIYEQKEAVGHAVRALYMYTAMADLAGTDGDGRLYRACRTLWDNIVNRKLYITGGIGGNPEGEAFSNNYELPNDMAYAETCASIAMVFFAHRMLESEMDGAYADIMEKELYNGIISGMQLDGKRYFYVNPLESEPGVSGKLFGYRHSLPERPGWYACACCPTNLVRLVTSLGKYCWSESDNAIYSHLYIGQAVRLEKADITLETSYPWEGKAVYRVTPKTEERFTLAIHIPYYVDLEAAGTVLTVGGEPVDAGKLTEKGYVYLDRKWKDGDVVELQFPMEVRKVYANQQVREDAGCVALMRGPVVYCFEGADNEGPLQSLRIPKALRAKAYLCENGILKGNVLIDVDGYRMTGGEELYSERPPVKEKALLRAIPYYAWANRGENQMRVWMLEEG